MSNNKVTGDAGELEVVEKVKCPNCGRKLMLLPPSFPLYDTQCTACQFRAQVKSSADEKPRDSILGATWDVMDKSTKAGYLVPFLITNNKWIENQHLNNLEVVPQLCIGWELF